MRNTDKIWVVAIDLLEPLAAGSDNKWGRVAKEGVDRGIYVRVSMPSRERSKSNHYQCIAENDNSASDDGSESSGTAS